nr:hypothetical protein [Bradyrhizobium diazoefficiens]
MMTLTVIATRVEVAEPFLGKSPGAADATIRPAEELLLVGASCFISDTVKTIAAGSLPGLKDKLVPLLFAGVSYWVAGFSVSYAGFEDRTWSHWHLDWLVDRDDGLCGAPRAAFPAARKRLALQSGYLTT